VIIISRFPDPGTALESLTAADWSGFTPEHDLPPLREALTALEREHGVTDAHRYATAKIREYGALLRHADTHRAEMVANALSPCGRYLALGSAVGEEFDDGGVLQIWEVATGRCVNVIDGIPGGVGWEADRHMIQWSADASRIAVVHQKASVGIWDTFGEEPEGEPIAAENVSDSRPTFAFAPDGERLMMWGGWYRNSHRGRLVSLDFLLAGGDIDDVEPLVPDQSLPEEALTVLDGDSLCLDWSAWSPDGERVYGDNDEGWSCSIDVTARTVAWLKETHDPGGPPPAWSPDGRRLACLRDGHLTIGDALTGESVVEHVARPGAASLCWSLSGRLAVLAPTGATPGVSVFGSDGRHDHDLDLAIASTDPAYPALTWSPDGRRAACLTGEGLVEVWDLGERPQRRRVIEAVDADSVMWGAGDTLVITTAVDANEGIFPGLCFVDAESGEMTGAFQFLRQPPGPNPLELEGEDLGEEFELHPAFALDARTWAVAFEPGMAIAPPGREGDLDALLAWTVERRFAWPVRWGGLEIFPNAAAAAEAAPPPLDDLLEPFLDTAPPPAEPPAWPPPDTATFADLLRLAGEVVVRIRSLNPQGGHAPAIAREIAILHARQGDAEQARRFVDLCPGSLRPQVVPQIEKLLRAAERGHAAPVTPDPPTAQELAALAEAHEMFQRTPRGQRSGVNAELVRLAAQARHISAILDRLDQAPLETYLGLGSHDHHHLTLLALRIVATGSDQQIQR
jgi:WD40 repeat protein